MLRLIRSWKNTLALISRIPPEVFALIPDFWDMGDRDEDVIALTHTCRTWREVFISRSSLWTDFDCDDLNMDKTRVYLDRSKSSPINLHLHEEGDLPPHHPFLQIVPHAIDRLKSLVVYGTTRNLQDITARISRPAPLLEHLEIDGDCGCEIEGNPVLSTTLFNGDLASLRELCLHSVRTELPWRDMVNLTSFMLGHTLPGDVSIRQLLDFFECAPHLRKIELRSAILTSGTQNSRLVSVACLKRMVITGHNPNHPPSLLLDHLIIPIGAKLTTRGDLPVPLIGDHLPRSLDNLRNLPGFTDIYLGIGQSFTRIQLSGPNGQVTMFPRTSQVNATCFALESLARFDTSRTERLKIYPSDSPSGDLSYRALLPMKCLRTFTLSHRSSPDAFIRTLDPNIVSSGIVVCPKLEELVLVLRLDGETLDIENVIGMAASRASRGAKLKSIRIVSHDESIRINVLELRKHVSHVECGPEVGVANEDSDGSDNEY